VFQKTPPPVKKKRPYLPSRTSRTSSRTSRSLAPRYDGSFLTHTSHIANNQEALDIVLRHRCSDDLCSKESSLRPLDLKAAALESLQVLMGSATVKTQLPTLLVTQPPEHPEQMPAETRRLSFSISSKELQTVLQPDLCHTEMDRTGQENILPPLPPPP
jgi:hypothetical protein